MKRTTWYLDAALYGVTALVYLFMLMPVMVVVLMAFNDAPYATFPFTGFTLKWFAVMAGNERILAALTNSLWLGLGSGVLATVFGTAAALALARHEFRGKGAIQLMLTLPILVPNIVLGVGLLLFFQALGQSQSFGLLLFGHTVLAMPFVVLMARHRLQSLPSNLVEAARTLGASPVQAFRQILLPLAAPAIVAGAMLAFMTSFDELPATLFWRPAGLETMTTRVMGMLEDDVSPEVNAVAVCLILISVGIPALAMATSAWMTRRRRRHDADETELN